MNLTILNVVYGHYSRQCFVPGCFHKTKRFQVPSSLYHILLLYSFILLSNIIYVSYHVFFFHSPVDKHLDCSYSWGYFMSFSYGHTYFVCIFVLCMTYIFLYDYVFILLDIISLETVLMGHTVSLYVAFRQFLIMWWQLTSNSQPYFSLSSVGITSMYHCAQPCI